MQRILWNNDNSRVILADTSEGRIRFVWDTYDSIV